VPLLSNRNQFQDVHLEQHHNRNDYILIFHFPFSFSLSLIEIVSEAIEEIASSNSSQVLKVSVIILYLPLTLPTWLVLVIRREKFCQNLH